MNAPLSPEQFAEIRPVDLLELMSDRSAGRISHYLAVLLAEVERLTGERDRFADRVDTLTAAAGAHGTVVAALTTTLLAAEARVRELESTRLAEGGDLR